MANTLVSPADLTNLPGAPFTDETVDAAVAQVRAEAGWHIAPVTDPAETVTLDGTRGTRLVLPSRKVVSIAEVRDVSNPAAPVVLTGWRLIPGAMLLRDSWPCGDAVVEVDMVHGHETTPPQLLELVAALAQAAQTNVTTAKESAGPFSVERASADELEGRLAAAWRALDPFRARTGF